MFTVQDDLAQFSTLFLHVRASWFMTQHLTCLIIGLLFLSLISVSFYLLSGFHFCFHTLSRCMTLVALQKHSTRSSLLLSTLHFDGGFIPGVYLPTLRTSQMARHLENQCWLVSTTGIRIMNLGCNTWICSQKQPALYLLMNTNHAYGKGFFISVSSLNSAPPHFPNHTIWSSVVCRVLHYFWFCEYFNMHLNKI